MTERVLATVERRNRAHLNAALAELCRAPHDGLPIREMADIATRYGFDAEPLDGIYTGREGRIHERIGERTWLTMTWYKLPVSGRFEIVAYAS